MWPKTSLSRAGNRRKKCDAVSLDFLCADQEQCSQVRILNEYINIFICFNKGQINIQTLIICSNLKLGGQQAVHGPVKSDQQKSKVGGKLWKTDKCCVLSLRNQETSSWTMWAVKSTALLLIFWISGSNTFSLWPLKMKLALIVTPHYRLDTTLVINMEPVILFLSLLKLFLQF